MTTAYGYPARNVLLRPVRRKIFLSYHHGGDAPYRQAFAQIFDDRYETVSDNSVERRIDSDDAEYVMRRIREKYLTGSSCIVVLCGGQTPRRKFVDWEILAALNQGMALVGLVLPSCYAFNGSPHLPPRLTDNLVSGYALVAAWGQVTNNPASLSTLIEAAIAKPRLLIDNTRTRMFRNA